MNELLLIKCGEMILKGLNRKRFEDVLIKNIRYRLKKVGNFKVYSMQSTLYVEANDDDANIDEALQVIRKVFGIKIIEKATVCEKNIESITETAIAYMKDKAPKYKTFKVETKRADKRFPMTSIQTSIHVGGEVADAYNLQADMHNPEITLYVEIRDKNAFVYAEKVKGAGGLPVSTNGRAMLLLSGGIDSPVAGYMMAKRGMTVDAIHFYSYPYTSEQAKAKVLQLASIMSEYTGEINVHIVPFTKIQESIRKNCKDDLFTLIMRRAMMDISCKVAREQNYQCLITGESLGQVASQTVQAIAVTDEICTIPVMRPCIGMDKDEIIDISVKMEAFETSILPYEDCCTVFTPKHPQTKPKISHIKLEEEKIMQEFETLIPEAIENIEIVKFNGAKQLLGV